MFRSYYKVILLIVIFILCTGIQAYTQITPDSQTKLSIRADTTFFDTIINGKKQVVRSIIFFDTLLLMPPLKTRKANTFSRPVESALISAPQTAPEAIFPYKPEWEAGVSFYKNYLPGMYKNFDYRANHNQGYTTGIYMHRKMPVNRWHWRLGLNLSYTQSYMDINRPFEQIDTSYNYIPYTYDSVFIDTAFFLDVNQLPDTVYIMHIDTFNFEVNDTLTETLYDTTTAYAGFEHINRYFHIELPVLFGYSFKFKNFSLDMEAGAYLRWLARVKGQTVDKYYGIRQLDEKYFHRITLDGAMRFRFSLPLSNLRTLTFTPQIRYTLFDIYRNDQFNTKKIIRVGFALGYIFY